MNSKTKAIFVLIITIQAFFIVIFLVFSLYQKAEADKNYIEAIKQRQIAEENKKNELLFRFKYDSLLRTKTKPFTPEPQ